MVYYDSIAQQLGTPVWLFLVIVIWTAIWKLLALWKAARNKHIAWFVVMGILNTVGILPILYIYVFSKLAKKTKKKSPRKKKKK